MTIHFLQGNGRVFDRQAQVPCAVACDAKTTRCDWTNLLLRYSVEALGFSLRIALRTKKRIIPFFLFCRGMDAYSTGKRKFLARLRVTRKRLDAIGQTYYFAIPSEPSASPYESRSAPKNGLFCSFCFAGEWTRLFVIAFEQTH